MIKVTRYTASWCGPCQVLAPVLEKVKQHFQGRNVVFEVIDIDTDKDRALGEGIRSVPTVKVGNDTIIGVQSFDTYVRVIEKFL